MPASNDDLGSAVPVESEIKEGFAAAAFRAISTRDQFGCGRVSLDQVRTT
jgi:hypothetical protein